MRALIVFAFVSTACGAPQVAPVAVDLPSTNDASTRAAAEDCGVATVASYTPTLAWSGRPSTLPQPVTLPVRPLRVGADYTVYGANHQLTSLLHNGDVAQKITIVGYIVSTNLATAPKCAFHHTGRADPPKCVAPIPAFTIADSKGDASGITIKVMGWASNFANVFEANEQYKKVTSKPAQLYSDELWAVPVPYPLPAEGAKVRVTGNYGFSFTMSSTGMESDPANGMMTAMDVAVLEPAPTPAKLP